MAVIVCGGVIEKDGKFLLVQEAKKECEGKWNIPAGTLDKTETIYEAAKREISEECGCRVELTGVLRIVNKIIGDTSVLIVIFSTKLLEENIKFDENEIKKAKWFSYDEIINMKEELRSYNWITDVITRYVNNKIYDIDIFNVCN